MAVEIPPASAWGGQPSVIVNNMQDVARNPHAWTVYQKLNPIQKENFREALSLSIVVPMKNVLEVSKGPAVAPPPPPPVPVPESIVTFQGSPGDFKGWLTRQAALVDANQGLQFHFGARYPLSDGTLSVPISIYRSGAEAAGTKFVFHYHPGADGPSVGHGYASQGHFKPFDGAAKYIRVERSGCDTRPVLDVFQAARHIARGH